MNRNQGFFFQNNTTALSHPSLGKINVLRLLKGK